MENLLEVVHAALGADVDPVARRAGLVACRKLLVELEGATEGAPSDVMGEPSAASPAESPPSPASEPARPTASPGGPGPAPASNFPHATSPPGPSAAVMAASLLGSLGQLPAEQLLDLLIARLRAALPAGASVPAVAPVQFQLIPLHHLERK